MYRFNSQLICLSEDTVRLTRLASLNLLHCINLQMLSHLLKAVMKVPTFLMVIFLTYLFHFDSLNNFPLCSMSGSALVFSNIHQDYFSSLHLFTIIIFISYLSRISCYLYISIFCSSVAIMNLEGASSLTVL